MANQINIVVKLQVEGFHFWGAAPIEVEFVRKRHRHTFFIKCIKEVDHSDRNIEIILFKRKVLAYLKS